MNRMFRTFLLLIPGIVLLLSSCQTRTGGTEAQTSNNVLEVKYANGFAIHYFDNYKQVIVNNPWAEGEQYACYYLVENDTITIPSDGVKIHIPITTLASGSVTHFEFLQLINELHTLNGICQANLIYNPILREKVEKGEVNDLGDSFQINVEEVMLLKPDALMMSGYNQTDANLTRISQAGIPVIYNNEWMEKELLGRAEWIKFISAFYNKEAIADSIFSAIENNYNTIRQKALAVTDKPVIMAGNNFRGTWYMPSGNSYMGRLFADAGADYYYASDSTAGSLPLSVETVMVNFNQSDVWLNANYNSLEELKQADAKHELFRPVALNQVYNFNKRTLESGANDFWESATARPDLLLADIISILHPELLPDHELVYADKLH